MDWLVYIRTLYLELGARRAALYIAGWVVSMAAMASLIVGFMLTHDWLAGRIGWPEAYGFECRRRGCLWPEMWHSHKLLTLNKDELFVFASIWFIPAIMAGIIAVTLFRRWLKRHRSRIRPLY